MILCRRTVVFSLSGVSAESEKKTLLCDLGVSSAAGGDFLSGFTMGGAKIGK